MSDTDHVLGLVDDLVRLLADSPATTIEVEADGFAVTVTRRPSGSAADASVERTSAPDAAAEPATAHTVRATTVGIFSASRAWNAGDAVKRDEVLGGIQTLGQVSQVKAAVEGRIKEVLVTAGAPVEYGQALFVIAIQ